jgi:hypothetical protein
MSKITASFIVFFMTAALCGCDAEVVEEATKAFIDGRIISNKMMTLLYPSSFHPGNPPYLERDFEAGANLICDEIKLKYGRDLCSEKEINWR